MLLMIHPPSEQVADVGPDASVHPPTPDGEGVGREGEIVGEGECGGDEGKTTEQSHVSFKVAPGHRTLERVSMQTVRDTLQRLTLYSNGKQPEIDVLISNLRSRDETGTIDMAVQRVQVGKIAKTFGNCSIQSRNIVKSPRRMSSLHLKSRMWRTYRTFSICSFPKLSGRVPLNPVLESALEKLGPIERKKEHTDGRAC